MTHNVRARDLLPGMLAQDEAGKAWVVIRNEAEGDHRLITTQRVETTRVMADRDSFKVLVNYDTIPAPLGLDEILTKE